MAITATTNGFILGFLVVTAATYVSTAVLTSGSSIVKSVITSLLTSAIWFGVTYLVSGVVGVAGYWVALGPVLAIVAYVLFVDLSYEGGIARAAAISLSTWGISFAILYAAAAAGYSPFEALGIPLGL